ncbi:MAG TPA: potassium channel protein [Vicinamibacteria bacterium]
MRSLQLAGGVLGLLLAFGTLGYVLVEGWSAFDALYMTVITLTTVGYLEVHPLSTAGRSFTMLLALGGVFTLFYLAGDLIRGMVSGEVARLLGRQRMERQLAALRNHMIVCGFGRMGHLVCEHFSTAGLPFVLVEQQAALLEGFRMPHGIPLQGDATSEDVLRRAGIDHARALVTAAASDADNLYITMTARLMNDKLLIVARAEEEAAERKLKRAGASRVVSPYTIGGQRVAQAVLRPNVMDFLELATKSEHMELQIEETEIGPGSGLAGQSLKDSALRQDLGIILVAIKKPGGRMVFNPEPATVLEARDLLISLGHRQQLDRLEQLARA